MNPPKWLLRYRLRKAARLLKNGVIDRSQYATLAMKIGHAIIGKPIQEGVLLEQYPFSLALGKALGLSGHHSENEYLDLLDRYGPFNEAMTIVLTPGELHLAALGKRQSFTWDAGLEETYEGANLRLSMPNRFTFWLQDWWKEQERIFPPVSSGVKYLVAGVVGALIGHCIK